jgi:guanylate kinase
MPKTAKTAAAGAARGELFILSAPSGAGKTTLIQHLLTESGIENIQFAVSHTTRSPREGEVDGEAYHFVTKPVFKAMIEDGAFLEWAEVHGRFYGTARAEVLPRLAAGADVLLDIDVQGAEQVLGSHPEAHSIFVLPPSYEALRHRLQRRNLDGARQISRRLAVSLWEIRHYDRYRYIIVNDDAIAASQSLAAVILEKRHQRVRMQERARQIVDDFERHLG